MTTLTMTELQAISQAKELLKNTCGENWTISYMSENDVEDYIWSYLFDKGLQYLTPIKYDNKMVALCHQQ
jgi:hypothetical protein